MGPLHHCPGYGGPHCAGGVSVRPQGSLFLLHYAVQYSYQVHPGYSDLHRDGIAAIPAFRPRVNYIHPVDVSHKPQAGRILRQKLCGGIKPIKCAMLRTAGSTQHVPGDANS